MIMNSRTKSRYRVSWKSDTQRTRKEAFFAYRDLAEEWYYEKLSEGKKPQFYKVEITTTPEVMRPQQLEDKKP